MKLGWRREFLTNCLLEGRDHRNTLPWPFPIDVVGFTIPMENCLVGSSNLLDQATQELFGNVQEVVHISISPIELAACKIRRMCGVDVLLMLALV